jgi:protein SCO1/2
MNIATWFSAIKKTNAPCGAVPRRLSCQLAGYASLLAILVLAVAPYARAADPHDHHHHHHQAEPAKALSQSEAAYTLPGLPVTRMDGSRAELAKELDKGGPVILNFIYTTCTAICPMTSQVFSSLQDKLPKGGEAVRLVSISIDPEQDTPARLSAYARQYSAGPQWQFYTGTAKNSIAIQKAFEVYRGDKMNHIPVTFLRLAPGKPWLRIEGMASPDELLAAYMRLKAAA